LVTALHRRRVAIARGVLKIPRVAVHEVHRVRREVGDFGPRRRGQRFRLRERGILSPRDGRRGDLVVEVKLVLPRILDERSKELLREFGRINGENVRESTAETGPTSPSASSRQAGSRRSNS